MNKQIVTQIINKWDPIGLFPHAPEDEYDLEIDQIVELLDQTDDVLLLAQGIHRVFTRMFEGIYTYDLDASIRIATAILQKLSNETY